MKLKSDRGTSRDVLPGNDLCTSWGYPEALEVGQRCPGKCLDFGLLLVDSSVGRIFLGNTDLVSGLFCCGISTAFLGLYDDLRGSGAKLKFAIQFAAAGALYSLGFRIDHIANPFGEPLALGMLSIPFTFGPA